MKKCNSCGLEKPLDDFYAAKGMKDGHKNQCKECMKIKYRKRHYETYVPHPRPITQFCPKGHDKDIVGRTEEGSCRECRRENSKTDYLKHPERKKQQAKKSRKQNPDKVDAQQKRYRERHAKQLKLKHKAQYIKTGKKLMCTPGHRYKFAVRNAKKRKLPFTLSFEEYENLITLPCHYCGISLQNEQGIGLDRISNDKIVGYIIENVLPSCGPCNESRNTHFTVDEWKIMMQACLKFRKQHR